MALLRLVSPLVQAEGMNELICKSLCLFLITVMGSSCKLSGLKTTQMYCLPVLWVRNPARLTSILSSESLKGKIRVSSGPSPFWRFWGRICCQTHSDCWLNSVSCACRTRGPISLLPVSGGPVLLIEVTRNLFCAFYAAHLRQRWAVSSCSSDLFSFSFCISQVDFAAFRDCLCDDIGNPDSPG